MAKKNPLMNCKSQKRKIDKIVKPYCPLAMVRYDNGNNGYPTMWVCKICLVCCLTGDAANQHSEKCRENFKRQKRVDLAKYTIPKKNPLVICKSPKRKPQKKRVDLAKVETPVETMLYTCCVCGVVFNRQVKLKKHIEIHGDVKINTVVKEEKIVIQNWSNKLDTNWSKLYTIPKKNPLVICKSPKRKPQKKRVDLAKVETPVETMLYTCCVCGVVFNRQVKLKKHIEIHGDIKINTVVKEEKIVIQKKTTEKQIGNQIIRTEEGLTEHFKIKTEYITSIPSTSNTPY